jgi:hypothetical protein
VDGGELICIGGVLIFISCLLPLPGLPSLDSPPWTYICTAAENAGGRHAGSLVGMVQASKQKPNYG